MHGATRRASGVTRAGPPTRVRLRPRLHPLPPPPLEPHAVPTVHLDVADGLAILRAFSLANRNLTATVSGRLTDYGAEAPAVAELSSIGPAAVDAYAMLKPDLIAPGVNVFAPTAAATPGGATTGVMMSGTSMASPHVAGAAALVKSKHPRSAPLRSAPRGRARVPPGRQGARCTDRACCPPLVCGAALSGVVRAEGMSPAGDRGKASHVVTRVPHTPVLWCSTRRWAALFSRPLHMDTRPPPFVPCRHLARRSWSGAAIKSALMTTASQTTNKGNRINGTAFNYGAGQIVPVSQPWAGRATDHVAGHCSLVIQAFGVCASTCCMRLPPLLR